MRRSLPPYGLPLIPLLVLLSLGPAGADIVHLRNGGTIAADTWEERDGNLIIRQGDGTIVVPRSDVLRIEREEPRPGARRPITIQFESPTPPPPPGNRASRSLRDLSADEIQERIEELKRRLRNEPVRRAERTREIVILLNHLGERAYHERDLDAAVARFREAQDHDRRDATASLGLAATYFAQGRDIYARSTLEQALLENPDDPALLLLLGDVYYSQERPEDALEAWESAEAIRPGEPVRRRIEKLRRERQVEESYRRSDAPHFTLKYDGQLAGPDLGAEILQHLEEQFSDMVIRFDFYPRQPIVVIVYPERQFREATLAEENVGGLFDGKIRVPIAGLRRLDAQARNVLVHELTHAFVAAKSGGAAPRWLQEGLAQHAEGRTTPPAVGRSLAEEYRSLQGAASWGTTFSYPAALSFVEHLIGQEGLFRILEALEAMGEGVGVEQAFQDATRYSLFELRQAWGEALVRRHLH